MKFIKYTNLKKFFWVIWTCEVRKSVMRICLSGRSEKSLKDYEFSNKEFFSISNQILRCKFIYYIAKYNLQVNPIYSFNFLPFKNCAKLTISIDRSFGNFISLWVSFWGKNIQICCQKRSGKNRITSGAILRAPFN